jgi:hypothetical protein
MSGDRQAQVVAHLRAAFREDADRAMAQADVGSAFVEFGARYRRDRHYRAVRAIAACLALLAGIAAAIGIMHGFYQQPRVTGPPASDPGGPRLNDPDASVPRPEQPFTGQGRRYLAEGFGPEFAFIEPPAPWRIAGPGTEEGHSFELGRPERGALYLVRGESKRSTQRLTFLVWRNVLDDHPRPSPTPPQLASWLAANRHLANVSQQPDTVSGMTAVRVDATVDSTPAYGSTQYCNPPMIRCLLLADNAEQQGAGEKRLYGGRVGPRAAYVERGALVRFWIVPLSNGEQLVIHGSAQPADFGIFIAEADQIVKSLVIAR